MVREIVEFQNQFVNGRTEPHGGRGFLLLVFVGQKMQR
jgi:hypothetical protein